MYKKTIRHGLVLSFFILGSVLPSEGQSVTFSSQPLNVPFAAPSNLLLSLSVEYPSANTKAHKDSNFLSNKAYAGYFDPNKCYAYVMASGMGISSNDHFTPTAYMTSAANQYYCHNVGGGRLWSGNFLNWMTMTTLDIFRKALTGGTRNIDTPTNTRLLRGWIDGRGQHANFPDVDLNASEVDRYTAISPVKAYRIARFCPTEWQNGPTSSSSRDNCGDAGTGMNNTNESLGDRFRIIDMGNIVNEHNVADISTLDPSHLLKISVKVCDNVSSVLEDNCIPYYKDGNGKQYYKPIGLVQEYQNRARFGVFSYPFLDGNDNAMGGVMRSPLKSVGVTSYTGNNVYVNDSSRAEIDAATGVFIFDPESYSTGPITNIPDPIDAMQARGNNNSGFINYINMFGYKAGSSGWHYKRTDPVGELFYESLRYFALEYNGGNRNATPEYLRKIGTGEKISSIANDGFPIVETFSDPILDRCQRNAVLFMGDANAACDQRIPGSPNYIGLGVNCRSQAISDTVPGLNVQQWIVVMQNYEQGKYPDILTSTFNTLTCPGGAGTYGQLGRGCWGGMMTANLVGLAYWANAEDIRPDLEGFQSVQTYTFDVHEQALRGRVQMGTPPYGQDPTTYWLAAKYGGFTFKDSGNDPNADPALWDADNDGVPDTFLKADNPQRVKDELKKMFEVQTKTRQSNGRIALSMPTNPQETKVYKTYFSTEGNSMWQGNVVKNSTTFSVNAGAATYSTGEATAFDQGAAGWLKNQTVNNQPRQIIAATRTLSGGAIQGTPFVWNNLSLYTQSLLKFPGDTETKGNQRLDYLTGERSLEISSQNPNNIFRGRGETVLGDIINSSPVYVGPAISGFSDSDFAAGSPSYKAFSQSASARRAMIYVGANDGMLHGFDADTLQEIFAFIPNSVLSKLKNLSGQNYTHDFYVDETPIIVESPIPSRGWVTQLIGFPGMGGTGLFALDVTSPGNTRPNVDLTRAQSNASSIVLWELNSETDRDIGHILNRGQINRSRGLSMQAGRMSNGRWAIVTGNGYNSPNNTTGLVVAYLDSSGGTLSYKKVMIAGVPGGLSSPTTVDIDFDGKIDYAYAGDLNGNMWRFDLRGAEATWSAFKLFVAKNEWDESQPITTAPAITFHCSKPGLMIIFGTGKYFEQEDNEWWITNSMYGLWDKMDNSVINYNQLLTQDYFSYLEENPNAAPHQAQQLVVTSDYVANWSTQRGWKLHLPGDKVVVPPYIVNEVVYINSTYPEFSACGAGGLWNTLMSLNACMGQRPDRGVFDINFDGKVDAQDQINYEGTIIHSNGVNVRLQDNVMDSSVWIDPRAVSCTDPANCASNSLETAFSDPMIGIDLQIIQPRRASWREIPPP